MYKFVHDWFSPNVENLTKIFSGYQGGGTMNILEVGALEGRSTVWFLENVPNCRVTTIDTWTGGKDHNPNNPEIDFKEIKENFDYNVSAFADRVRSMQIDSYTGLTQLISENQTFQFAFIDGSHTAIDVNLDLILAFKLLSMGGMVYADDYYWGFDDRSIYESPKLGIDSFVNVYADKLQVMKRLDNQAVAFIKVEE